MKVLVTGAGGFLGRQVVQVLLESGHATRALLRPASEPDGLPPVAEVVRADLRGGDLAPALDGVEVVVHLAASVGGSEREMLASTVRGTERLLEAAEAAGVRRIVLASSFAVYDWSAAEGALSEESPVGGDLEARGHYALTKVWQERLCRRASERSGMELVVLRPGFVWGRPGDAWAGVGMEIGPAAVVFGPRRQLPLVHVESCARCFAAAAVHPAAAGEVFNVVDEPLPTAWRYAVEDRRRRGLRRPLPVPYALASALVRSAFATARALLGPTAKVPSLFVPARFEARFKPLAFSAARARQGLGWSPPFGFDEALRRTHDPAPRQ